MSAVIAPCWWSIVRDHNPTCSQYKPDFISLYTGAELVWTDRSSLYDLERQRSVQAPIDPSRSAWVLPYFYPPFFAIALAPLAWIHFSAALVAMTLANLTLLILAMVILARKLDFNRRQTNWLILTTFCNYGVHYGLLEGQTSFIALVLLSLFFSDLDRSSSTKCGIWSSLLLFKPPLAIMPLLILVRRQHWRALAVTAVIVAVLGVISWTAIGWDGIGQYLNVSRRAMAGDEYMHIQPERMHNLRALIYFFFTDPWREYLWWVATATLAGMVIIQSRLDGMAPVMSLTKWLGILISLILISPHLHDHDLTLLILVSACVIKLAGDPLPPFIALAVVGLGILGFVNTIAYPYLPPLVPLVLLPALFANLWYSRIPGTVTEPEPNREESHDGLK